MGSEKKRKILERRFYGLSARPNCLVNYLNTTIKKKNLIYAWTYIEWGGVQTYTISLLRAVRHSYEVLVVLPVGSSPELKSLLEKEGANCEYFGPRADTQLAHTIGARIKRRLKIIRSEWSLLRHILKKDLQDTIVHIDLAPQKSFLTFTALCLKTHVFFTIHNSFPRKGRFRESSWLLKVRFLSRFRRFHIFAANEDAKRYLAPYLSKKASRQISLIRAAIDPVLIEQIAASDFDRKSVLAELGIPHDMKVVLTVGQFIDRKGRWTHLEAVAKLVKERDDLVFVWLTPESPGEFDLERVRKYDVEKAFRIVLSSEVGSSREEVLTFFRIGDLFVLPSYVEGVPIALVEAMALGLPCISTNINGIPEAIRSGVTGLLIEPGDSIALAEAVEQMVDNPALSKDMAEKGMYFVRKEFDERESARIALREYDDCFTIAADENQAVDLHI